ncbi:hypothetical protein [Lentibacillus salicampi]|uniref:Uncharacterized protein n=1 Tax=Lentibacillus salicampi TaxID=175306 RepID=A0A4Y9AAQ4_9BACI|nr:hypothetical protein [Lentibacillus salicampi]TFJ92505.1 hypothetical protein E4U82_11810 [Lentibacillus salicampi]
MSNTMGSPVKKQKKHYRSEVVKRSNSIPPAKNNTNFEEMDMKELIELYDEYKRKLNAMNR